MEPCAMRTLLEHRQKKKQMKDRGKRKERKSVCSIERSCLGAFLVDNTHDTASIFGQPSSPNWPASTTFAAHKLSVRLLLLKTIYRNTTLFRKRHELHLCMYVSG